MTTMSLETLRLCLNNYATEQLKGKELHPTSVIRSYQRLQKQAVKIGEIINCSFDSHAVLSVLWNYRDSCIKSTPGTFAQRAVESWKKAGSPAVLPDIKAEKYEPSGAEKGTDPGNDSENGDGYKESEGGDGEDEGNGNCSGKGDGDGEGDGDGDGNGEGDETGDGEGDETDSDDDTGSVGDGFPIPVPKPSEDETEPTPVPPLPRKDPLFSRLPEPLKSRAWEYYNQPHLAEWVRITLRLALSKIAYMDNERLAPPNIYVAGPKGAGKTHILAEICKLIYGDDVNGKNPFFSISAINDPVEIFGYKDVHGKDVVPEFLVRYTAPGIINLDEFDRLPEYVKVQLNQALANGFIDSPVGRFYRNPLCTITATGNTNGMGATEGYETATKTDMSTLDRFKTVTASYNMDTALYISAAYNNGVPDTELVDFIWEWNKSCRDNNPLFMMGYRPIMKIQEGLMCGLSLTQALQSGLLQDMVDSATVNQVLTDFKAEGCPVANKYKKALKECCKDLEERGL